MAGSVSSNPSSGPALTAKPVGSDGAENENPVDSGAGAWSMEGITTVGEAGSARSPSMGGLEASSVTNGGASGSE